jgi:hypothetical protein
MGNDANGLFVNSRQGNYGNTDILTACSGNTGNLTFSGSIGITPVGNMEPNYAYSLGAFTPATYALVTSSGSMVMF